MTTQLNPNLKQNKIITMILLIASLTIITLLIVVFYIRTNIRTKFISQYQIEEQFLCSDYCPNPIESYRKKVYKGVTSQIECAIIGGTYYVYSGWGDYKVCLVN